MSKDHFFPKSRGGRLMVRACHSCNSIKEDKTPFQWAEWIKKSTHPNKERILNATVSLAERCEMVFRDGMRHSLVIE